MILLEIQIDGEAKSAAKVLCIVGLTQAIMFGIMTRRKQNDTF